MSEGIGGNVFLSRGFRVGVNNITFTKINKWSHRVYEVGINEVAEEVKRKGFEVVKAGERFLKVIFNSDEDVYRFYHLVMSI
jgi:ribonucleotide monophosphatase NagD (HAD superfamily)